MVSTGLFVIIALAAAIWIIYEVWTKNKKLDQTQKMIWTACAVIFNVIAAVVYFVVYKAK